MQSNLFLTLSQIPTQILISSGSTGFSQHCYKQGTPLRTVFSVCFPTTIINSQLMKLLFTRLYFYNTLIQPILRIFLAFIPATPSNINNKTAINKHTINM